MVSYLGDNVQLNAEERVLILIVVDKGLVRNHDMTTVIKDIMSKSLL